MRPVGRRHSTPRSVTDLFNCLVLVPRSTQKDKVKAVQKVGVPIKPDKVSSPLVGDRLTKSFRRLLFFFLISV